jgi:hypothetical protein
MLHNFLTQDQLTFLSLLAVACVQGWPWMRTENRSRIYAAEITPNQLFSQFFKFTLIGAIFLGLTSKSADQGVESFIESNVLAKLVFLYQVFRAD